MADNTANIKVNVTSTGDESLAKNAASTAASYKSVEASLAKAAATSTRMPKAAAAAKAAAQMENTEYGMARGTAGTTGAAGRDFANQAQGLGGLVHLYATFAANIFAATAAFSALSKAMDTTNMVKGLDQLGAASGRNLGTLAKSLSLVSDGALSLRDSMEAVAKASSAGMTNDQIERMGKVAKNASQALGVAMPDAISRLSRGISKIEPELLDELGIFVRVDKAAQDYARTVGKTVSSLSDFERRQAYAVAVLKEGEQKFAAISIESNSYAKLLASLGNIAQKAGEAINTIFGPIAKMLAENTGVLSAALAGIVGMLLNRAIPAISQWRKNLQIAANEAKEKAESIKTSWSGRFVERTEASLNIPALKAQLKQAEKEAAISGKAAADARAEAFRSGTLAKNSAIFKALQQSTSADISPDLLKKVKDSAQELSTNEKEAMQLRAKNLALIEKTANVDIAAKQKIIAITKELASAQEKVQEKADSAIRKGSQEWQRYEIARKAAAKAERLGILANVERAAKEGGIGEGFRTLKEGITDSKTLSGLDKLRTRIVGTFTIATSAVTTFLSSINQIFFYVGIAIAAFKILDSWLSTTGKEAEETSRTLENLNSSIENLGRTMELISKKDFLEQLNPDSVAAKFTALSGISDAMVKAVNAAQEELKKMNWWDVSINWIKSLWGGDVQNKLNEGLASALADSFKALSGSTAETTAKEQIKTLLNISGETKESIQKGLEEAIKVNPSVYEMLVQKQKEFSKAAAETAAKLKEVKDAHSATTKSIKDYMNTLIPKDPMSEFAINIISESKKINEALRDPFANISATLEGIRNLSELQPLTNVGNEFRKLGINIEYTATEYQKMVDRTQSYRQELNKLNKELQVAQQIEQKGNLGGPSAQIMERNEEGRLMPVSAPSASSEKLKEKITAVQNLILATEKESLALENKIKAAGKELLSASYQIFDKGVEILSTRAAQEFAKANSVYLSGLASLLGETEAAIQLQLESDKASIAAQQQAIKSQIDLALQTERNTLATEALRISIEKDIATLELNRLEAKGADDTVISSIVNKINQLNKSAETTSQRGAALENAYSGNKEYLDVLKQQAKTVEERSTYEYAIEQYLRVQFALAQQAGLSAQMRVKELQAAVNTEKIRNQIKVEEVDNELKLLSVTEQQLATIKNYNSLAGVIAAQELLQINAKKTSLEIDKEILIANTKISAQRIVLQELIKSGKTDQVELTRAEIARLETNLQLSILVKSQQAAQKAVSDEIEIINKKLAITNELADEYNKSVNDTTAFLIEQNSTQTSLLEALKNASYVSEDIYISEKNKLAILREELTYQTSLNTLTQQQSKDVAALEARKAAALAQLKNIPNVESGLSTQDAANAAAINVELDEIERKLGIINYNYKTASERLAIIFGQKKELLNLTKEIEESTKRWEDIFKNIAASTLSLTALFGEMGAKIGLATEAFAKLGQIMELNSKKEEDAQKRLLQVKLDNANRIDEGDPDAIKAVQKAQEDLDKQKRKSTKDEISALAAVAGATKNMFKEKTAAYKVLAATEKALHIARITMDAIEMASDAKKAVMSLAASAKEQAGSFAAMIVKGGEAVINAMTKLPPPLNFAAGAAMAAAVAAVISSVGGSGGPTSPSGTGGRTAEEKQQVQGTGQTWQDNRIVETGRGVFGDPTAKLETISKSLEIVRDKSINFLPLFDQMVMYLESIDAGVNNTAKALYTANLGKAFEGLNKSTSSFDIPVVGKLLSSMFGGSKKETLIDYGIKFGESIGSTFADIFSTKAIKTFATVSWEKSGGWFGKDKSGISERIDVVNEKIGTALKDIFDNATTTFQDIANYLGKDINVSEVLKSLKIDEAFYLSIKDLKGEDLQKELGAVVGSILDEVTYKLFDFAKNFQQFGEDLFTTLIRITDTNKKVTYALKNIGIDIEAGLTQTTTKIPKTIINTFVTDIADGFEVGLKGVKNIVKSTFDFLSGWETVYSGVTESGYNQPTYTQKDQYTITQEVTDYEIVGKTIKEQSIEITESLVKMAGGMEEFAKGINFYMENFLTAEEKKNLLTKNVTTEVARLNSEFKDIIGTNELTSIEGFKKVMTSLGDSGAIATENGQKLYTALMNLAPAFFELYSAGSTAEETASRIAELTAQLYRLQGRTDEAIAIERKKALEDLKTDEEKSIQQQIWALEDELKIRKLNTDLLTAEGKTWEALLASRQEELRVLTDAERIVKNQIYAAQDKAKSDSLDLRILELQGRATEVLTIRRNKELLTLSDIIDATGKSDRMRQQEIWTLEDTAKLRSMDIELLNAQGLAQEALTLTRQQELEALTEEQKAKKLQIYAAQDAAKNMSLYTQYLKASGLEAEAIARERSQALMGASTEVNSATGMSDRQILEATYAAEDLAKQRNLEIELMNTLGYGYQALLMTRRLELRTLSASEKALKKQIYAAQDAMKTYNLSIQLMRAMGNETGALAAERELELRNLSETDQEIQKLIWAYEDQKEAADKLKDSLDGITQSLKDNIKSLQDYKKSLLISEQSPYTTGQKYNETRSRIFDLLQTISAPAQTEEQQRAQSNAVSELQTVSTTFLDLSRKLFSSSGQYNSDFNWILQILDTATGSLESQLTDAEKQLAELQKTNAYLDSLNKTATELLAKITIPTLSTIGFDSTTLYDSVTDPIVTKLDELKTNTTDIIDQSTTAATATPVLDIIPIVDSLKNIVSTEDSRHAVAMSKLDEIYGSLSVANDQFISFTSGLYGGLSSVVNTLGSMMQETINFQANNLQANTRNVETAIYNTNNNTVPFLQAMIDQLRVLTEKVGELEQATIDMGLMNVEATQNNTTEINSAITNSTSTNLYNGIISNRIAIA